MSKNIKNSIFDFFCTRFEVLAWLLEKKVTKETYPYFKNKEGSFNKIFAPKVVLVPQIWYKKKAKILFFDVFGYLES